MIPSDIEAAALIYAESLWLHVHPQTGTRVNCVPVRVRSSVSVFPPHLGGDDEEGGLWVELSQGLGEVCPVDVGHKPHVWPSLRVGLEGLRNHEWSLVTHRETVYLISIPP